MESVDDSESNVDVIKLRDYVIIKKADQLAVQKLVGKCRCILWARKIDLSDAVGKPYWSTFKLELITTSDGRSDQDLIKRPSYRLRYCDDGHAEEEIVRTNVTDDAINIRDNRELLDDNRSQNLSRNDINDMKERGESTRDIIKRLVENSSSFYKKTVYSQEKYVNKKLVRHTEYVRIFKPSLRLLVELYRRQRNSNSNSNSSNNSNSNHHGRSSKMLTIPFDMLSNLIGSINVVSNGRYILYEDGYQGIVLAALLTYLGNEAKIYNVVNGEEYDQNAVEILKFDKGKLEQIINVNCDATNIIIVGGDVDSEDNFYKVRARTIKRKLEDSEPDDKLMMIGRFGLYIDRKIEDLFDQDKADGLIVISKGIPNVIVKTLLNYVKPSRPFVIYSAYQSVLTDLYFELKQERGNAINVRLRESLLRTYQVLDGRTRPRSTMDGASGFLLTGTVVEL